MAKNYWQRLQEERSKKLSKLVNELKESVQLDEAGYEHGFADPNAPQLGAQAKAASKGAEMRQELGHETNNIAIAINGKTWKVVPGRGYADSKEEWSYLNNMKNWAAKKSASSGKKWTVHLTGAPVTVSEQGVTEGSNDITPNWAKYVLDQLYNSNGAVTMTDLFDEGIPGLRDMFMDVAKELNLDPEEEFIEVESEVIDRLESFVKGGHSLEEDLSAANPITGAITRRILMQRLDLVKQYGPELVGAAIDNVADYVGDVDEIGSSDISAWVAQVERMLKENPPEAFDEARANTAGARAGLAKRKETKPVSPEEQIAKDRAKFEKWKAKNQKPAYKGINEFTRSRDGREDGPGDDPYKYPKPEHYARSIEFFSRFEADQFDREDMDDATGTFKGYWGDKQIASFKFDNPQRTGADDPGIGWYYEPQSDSTSNSTSASANNSNERKQQELGMINAFLKSGQQAKPGSQIYNLMKQHGMAEGLNEFAPDEGGGARKFIPWTEFIEQVKQIVGKDFSCKENVVKSTIKARFVPHDPMEYGPTMLYSYYETRAGGRNKGAISTRGAIQVGKYTKGGLFGHAPDQLLTGFHLLKGHPFERHFDLTFDNIYKIANIIQGNTKGALEFQPQQQGVAENTENPYGYEVGQQVKLGNGQQGRVIDIFDDSIEVLLPGGRTITVDFRDAQVLGEQGVAEGALDEFAPGNGGGESGRWYTDDQMTDIVGDGWWQDLDISGDVSKQEMINEAQAWLADNGYRVQVLNVKVNDDDCEWFIEGSFQNNRFAKKGVAEGALDELHADLSAKFNELAPSIQKHKDVAGANNLFRELTLIAKKHNAIPVFKSMLNGARNNAHMDYDTNPGGFENWFWYLPIENDLDETIGKVKGGYRLYSKKGKNLGTFPSKSGAEKHEREVQYFKHIGEDGEGAEETVDDILYKLTYANRRVQQADYLADNTKDDCRTIYELLRNPLRNDNMPEYLRMLKYVQGRYPDAWDNFSDEMDGMVNEDDEGVSEEELAEIIFNRLEMRYPRIVERFGHDVVGEAVMDVANFHAGATELGTSDISIMIHEVIKKLNTRMQEDSWHGTGDAWHGDGNDPTNMWHGMSTAGPYISNEGKK